MSRKPGEKSETEIYHVIVQGIGQQDIFSDIPGNRKKVFVESGVSVLGYCLMTNHVHLLLSEDDGDIRSVPMFFSKPCSNNSSEFNRRT